MLRRPVLMLDSLCKITPVNRLVGFGRLYKVPDVKETCMLVAREFVSFRYHMNA